MKAFSLRIASSPAWLDTVLQDFDSFLLDHAAAEKKASGMAVSMLSHYPDKPAVVAAMADLAIEEMTHFREVIKLIHRRGLQLAADSKDPYVNALRDAMRSPKMAFFLDRLLVGSIVEARGCERFQLIAKGLAPGELQKFYRAIAESESRHEDLFINLASQYFAKSEIDTRLNELLDLEAEILQGLPLRAALH